MARCFWAWLTFAFFSKFVFAQNSTIGQAAQNRLREEIVNARAAGSEAKEILSFLHLLDLIAALDDPRVFDRLNLDADARYGLFFGIIDSDKGKLRRDERILMDSTPESDRLFDFLCGRGSPKSRKVLRELLDTTGHVHQTLLNSQMTNSDIRNVFSHVDALRIRRFVHEFPGIFDALKDFESEFISEKAFVKRLGANLFHNGPHAGYWSRLTDEVDGLLKTIPGAQKLFDGTVFRPTSEQALVYPNPITVEGALHLIVDRLSQSTGGGYVKIFLELNSLDPLVALRAASLDNANSSLLQLGLYREELETMNFLTAAQRQALIEWADEAATRVKVYRDRVFGRSAPLVKLHENSVSIDGRRLKARGKSHDDRFEILKAFEKVISRVEEELFPLRKISFLSRCSDSMRALGGATRE